MKKIIFILLLIILSTNIYAVTDSTGFTIPTSQSITGWYGVITEANTNITNITVTKKSSSTSTSVRLYNYSDCTVIAEASYSGDVATFGSSANISQGSNFSILSGASGTHTMYRQNTGVSYPISATNVDFLDSANHGGCNVTAGAYGFEVLQITSDEYFPSSPPTASSNFTINATNIDTSGFIQNLNASIEGDDNYTTTSYNIITELLSNSTQLWNITISSQYYFDEIFTNYNVSSNLTANLTPYTQIRMYDNWNESQISDFNVTWNSTIYESSSSVVYLPIRNTNINFTVQSNNYFNKTFENIDTTYNYNGTLIQTDLEFNVYEKFSNSQILNFTLYTDNGTYSTTNGSIYLQPSTSASYWNLTSTGYYNLTNITLPFSALDNTTYNLTQMFTNKINITAISLTNSSSITNFTAIATDLTNGYQENLSTTTGQIIFNVTNGTWQITIQPDGFEYQSTNITTTALLENYTFYLYTTNSILFTFIDEITNTTVNFTTIEMEFISDLFSYNYTTTNGSLYVDLLSPQNYTLRYRDQSNIYYEGFYYFNLENNTHSNITIYMLNASVYENVTANVVDEVLQPVENAFIKVLKYQQSSNTFKLLEIVETNFEGKANLHLTLNDEYYKFIIEYNGETKKTTSPTYVFSNEITFQITLEDVVAQEYFYSGDVSQTLTFNNATNNFVYEFNDINNVLTQACMYVYRIIGTTETLYNSSCESSTSGTILLNIEEINNTVYRADTYLTFESDPIFTKSLYKSFSVTLNSGSTGPLMVALLVITFAGLSLWNITVAMVVTPLAMIFASITGLWDIGLFVGVSFEIIGLLIGLYISKTQGV